MQQWAFGRETQAARRLPKCAAVDPRITADPEVIVGSVPTNGLLGRKRDHFQLDRVTMPRTQ